MKLIFSKSHANSLYNIVVIPSAKKTYMTEKIPYIFRQNTDFFYFTGCLEPDSAVVIHGASDENFKSELFVKRKDAKAELWDGPRTGVEVAPKLFAVDDAHPVEDLGNFLQQIKFEHPSFCLWYDNTSYNETTNAVIKHFLSQSGGMSWNVPKQLFHQLRLYKSDSEQEMMRETCRIASEGFKETIGFSKPGRTEHELFTKFDYEVRMRGAQILAYPPVVASGDNANVIHYVHNNQKCCHGDLLLMDAGCELNGYDSDITRTWPISGQFTDHQKVLYEIVLDTQLKLLKLCEKSDSALNFISYAGEKDQKEFAVLMTLPLATVYNKLCENLPSLDDLFSSMCSLIGSSLVDNHIVTKTYAAMNDCSYIGFKFCPHHSSHYLGMDVHDCAAIPRTIPVAPGVVFTVEPGKSQIGFKFCPHHSSHYLGMDVHDCAAIPRTIPVAPGMVFTVEPGVYISKDCKETRPEFRGMGIRIEDDILIDKSSNVENLSAMCPKNIDEIESVYAMRKQSV
ncbi:xaa-Pro aminopeptidase 3-like [Diaphorina citri]|uniref:Xaa-Pro aminopeptidase 3-like n=1 Tax=Diaphorina citri TaxID=121845 RepID=A0A3Q0J367_DIACI|nr:xaa-Pro aminopeptidase 3-like [Diaphorina citri]